MRRIPILALLAVISTVGATSVAQASSVAYLDKGGVWVSSLDGKKKRKITGKTGDGLAWSDLAQADNGRVIAVRWKRGLMPLNNRFTLWGPTGKQIYRGLLKVIPGWVSYAFPLSLDLTANGKTVVYGYSNFTFQVPVSLMETGTYVLYADRPPASQPFSIPGEMWPTTVGDRLVTRSNSVIASVQNTGGQPPWVDEFTPWVDFSGRSLELQRTDVAANGKVMAGELVGWSGSTIVEAAIEMVQSSSLGGTILNSCLLPTRGLAEDVTVSQDGNSVAWHDARGVVVAGTPIFGGSGTCALKRRPVVISKSGSAPSIGRAKVRVGR